MPTKPPKWNTHSPLRVLDRVLAHGDHFAGDGGNLCVLGRNIEQILDPVSIQNHGVGIQKDNIVSLDLFYRDIVALGKSEVESVADSLDPRIRQLESHLKPLWLSTITATRGDRTRPGSFLKDTSKTN